MSDILTRKYRTVFRRFDIDNDGVASLEDVHRFADRACESEQADSSRRKTMRENVDRFYDLLISFGSKEGKVTEEEFINGVRQMVLDPKFSKILRDIPHIIFLLLDIDGDGYIQEGEYIRFFYNIGCADHENMAKAAFKEMDTDQDGVLSYDEFRKASVDFWTSDSETCPGNIAFGPLE